MLVIGITPINLNLADVIFIESTNSMSGEFNVTTLLSTKKYGSYLSLSELNVF